MGMKRTPGIKARRPPDAREFHAGLTHLSFEIWTGAAAAQDGLMRAGFAREKITPRSEPASAGGSFW